MDDATKMAFSDESFHFIVDKSLLDCIFWVKDVEIDKVISRVLSEYFRYTSKGLYLSNIITEAGLCINVVVFSL